MHTPIEANTEALRALLTQAGQLPEAGEAQEPVEAATPVISVGTDGLITARSEQQAGTVAQTTRTATYQLTAKAAASYTPGTQDQVIPKGLFLTGDQTLRGDPQLKEANIRKGVSLFGISGSYEGASGGGLPAGVTALVTGEFIPSEDISSGQDVNHGLETTPNFFLWFLADDSPVKPTASAAIYGGIFRRHTEVNGSVKNELMWTSNGLNLSGTFGGTQARVQNSAYLTDTVAKFCTNSTYLLKTGCRYLWVCGVMKDVS